MQADSTSRRAIVTSIASRIDKHLHALRRGHDVFGHLFAIERLARAARTDLWAADTYAPERDRE
jgi:hypothetical protein